MSHRLIQSYTAFTSKGWQPDSSGSDPRSILAFVSTLSAPNHSVLLRALLDREHQARKEDGDRIGFYSSQTSLALPGMSGLSSGPTAYALAQQRLEWVKEETALKFVEFRDKWRKRLALIQLHPFLQRNQWFVLGMDGGVVLQGKGTRKESKMLYLQTLHDMASDGERQVSSMSGHLFRFQGEIASVWHKESITDDRSRLLPALEETLRAGEAELCKRVRLSLGDLAMETFTERVGKWEKRSFATEEELFPNIAWPWCHPRYRSGFEGFMESFTDLAEAVSEAMIKHYETKWDLFLRGLAPLAETAAGSSQNSSGENNHV